MSEEVQSCCDPRWEVGKEGIQRSRGGAFYPLGGDVLWIRRRLRKRVGGGVTDSLELPWGSGRTKMR